MSFFINHQSSCKNIVIYVILQVNDSVTYFSNSLRNGRVTNLIGKVEPSDKMFLDTSNFSLIDYIQCMSTNLKLL